MAKKHALANGFSSSVRTSRQICICMSPMMWCGSSCVKESTIGNDTNISKKLVDDCKMWFMGLTHNNLNYMNKSYLDVSWWDIDWQQGDDTKWDQVEDCLHLNEFWHSKGLSVILELVSFRVVIYVPFRPILARTYWIRPDPERNTEHPLEKI